MDQSNKQRSILARNGLSAYYPSGHQLAATLGNTTLDFPANLAIE
jgi:hypothetical protein